VNDVATRVKVTQSFLVGACSKKPYLIDLDPTDFKTLASAELMETGNNWAPLALSDGELRSAIKRS